MTGGPSQVDTFDYKPELQRRNGQTLAGADPRTGFFTTSGRCLKSPFSFRRKETFRIELLFQLFKSRLQCADPLQLHRKHAQLILAAWLINGELALDGDFAPVLQQRAVHLQFSAE